MQKAIFPEGTGPLWGSYQAGITWEQRRREREGAGEAWGQTPWLRLS